MFDHDRIRIFYHGQSHNANKCLLDVQSEGTLFAYFEYHGTDFSSDMAKMAADPNTQRWWNIMMPMQDPVPNRAEGEWWANMEEVFLTD